ncbi:MAG: AAA family ATPase [Oscillospiraceae bacterium]|nr:AAA family ATPase [Oscillospiraceae bacterium]
MDSRETKRTVPYPSVGAGGEQPNSQICTTDSISEAATENNPQEKSLEERLLEMRRMTDPAYLPTISMSELYQNVYQGRPPIIDGLLCSGTYLFAGAPKVGKSFLVAQLAYHVSTGQKLWEYEVRPGTVLYLALEDDYQRLQERMFRMFGVEETDKLYFATYAKQLGNGLDEQLDKFVREHPDTRLNQRDAEGCRPADGHLHGSDSLTVTRKNTKIIREYRAKRPGTPWNFSRLGLVWFKSNLQKFNSSKK